MQYSQIITLLGLVTVVFGHVELSSPAPFRGRTNPNSKNIDYSGTSPLSGAGAFPCKGYHSLAQSDPTGEGAPIAVWKTGDSASFTFAVGAGHTGGSCQASLSYDSGKTWTVIHSTQGGCPLSSMAFKVPSDAPLGKAIGSWSWVNRVGNREFYQNCFALTVEAGSGGAATVPFTSRPAIFVANIGTNTCKVKDAMDARFPNPGPDVTGEGDADSLTGNCGASTGGSPTPGKQPAPAPAPAPGSPASSPTSPTSPTASVRASSLVPISSASRASSVAGGIPTSGAAPPGSLTTILTHTSTLAPVASRTASLAIPAPPVVSGSSVPVGSAPTGSSTGPAIPASTNLEISGDGTCKDKKCPGTTCCSSSGYCGSSPSHCGVGCQPAFGTCSGSGTVKARGLSGRIRWY